MHDSLVIWRYSKGKRKKNSQNKDNHFFRTLSGVLFSMLMHIIQA